VCSDGREPPVKSVEQSVIEVISKSLHIEEAGISRSASLATDLHADSLDAVELIMTLEERFGIEIPDEDAENLQTVQQLIDYVQDALNFRSSTHP